MTKYKFSTTKGTNGTNPEDIRNQIFLVIFFLVFLGCELYAFSEIIILINQNGQFNLKKNNPYRNNIIRILLFMFIPFLLFIIIMTFSTSKLNNFF